jgi:hypothetical protein
MTVGPVAILVPPLGRGCGFSGCLRPARSSSPTPTPASPPGTRHHRTAAGRSGTAARSAQLSRARPRRCGRPGHILRVAQRPPSLLVADRPPRRAAAHRRRRQARRRGGLRAARSPRRRVRISRRRRRTCRRAGRSRPPRLHHATSTDPQPKPRAGRLLTPLSALRTNSSCGRRATMIYRPTPTAPWRTLPTERAGTDIYNAAPDPATTPLPSSPTPYRPAAHTTHPSGPTRHASS